MTTAAFRRLCVETMTSGAGIFDRSQPPSGGCVLKLESFGVNVFEMDQPPSGGCVLKPACYFRAEVQIFSRLQAAVC